MECQDASADYIDNSSLFTSIALQDGEAIEASLKCTYSPS